MCPEQLRLRNERFMLQEGSKITEHSSAMMTSTQKRNMPNQQRSRKLFIETKTAALTRRSLNNTTCSSGERMTTKFIRVSQSTSRQTQYHPNHILSTRILSSVVCLISVAILCLRFSTTSALENGSQIMPTVIVRGFLNYRTTVDGTVLVFTPDAGLGGSTSSSVLQSTIAPTSTSAIQIAPTSLVAPSSVSQESRTQENRADGNQLLAEMNGDSTTVGNYAQADVWSPIQASPPLNNPTPTASFQPVGEPSVVSATALQPEAASQPPKQPEIVLIDEPVKPAEPTSRAKRPSLGFTGQSIRWKPADKSNRARIQESNAAPTGGQQQNMGSINGIRRPGLSTTSAPAIPVLLSEEVPSGNSTRGRLRHKFKRPNFSSGLKQTTSTTASLPPTSSSQLQSAESGQDLVMGEQFIAPGESNARAQVSPPLDSPMLIIPVDPQLNQNSPSAGAPVVGSDEILAGLEGGLGSDSPSKPMSRSGETRPRAVQSPDADDKMLSGQLVSSGSLSSDPLNFDTLFQGDQPQTQPPPEASQPKPSQQPLKPDHHAKLSFGKNHGANDRLTGWMDQHAHSKFVPRPASSQHDQSAGRMSQQLSAKLDQLEPSFSSNLPSNLQSSTSLAITPTPASTILQAETLKPEVGAIDEITGEQGKSLVTVNKTSDEVQLQTITKTYSTVMTSSKTRMVPLQVKSTTAIYTITEQYVITKMLTAYQTMPMGEFILPEPMSTRSPFEMFNEANPSEKENSAPAAPAPVNAPAISAPSESQEQPISLDNSSKSPNDWLHDFSNPFGNTGQTSQQSAQNQLAAALLEQQAQQANGLVGFPGLMGGETLDQLSSTLDPATLLSDGAINIPDLNNPLVLAAAIQNPQLAAVILAAQQLQLQKRQKQSAGNAPSNLQAGNNQPQLQPSYSTTLSTVVRPSTYTVRDTMYTTRLVSFKDGRTVRTRTVSEPGSVIEQVLTTVATEVTPVTVTIRPTGMLTVPSGPLMTAAPGGAQSTINNALIATQLASLLARRQQQLQPGMTNPALLGSPTSPQQLSVLQQLLAQQQRSQTAKQFQPNLQQLLQTMGQQPQQQQQQQQQQTAQSQQSPQQANNNDRNFAKPAASQQQQVSSQTPSPSEAAINRQQAEQAPAQPAAPMVTQPITTVLTNFQVRTYTVHNAFKTIYRTITSTQLVTSTIFPGIRASQMPMLG